MSDATKIAALRQSFESALKEVQEADDQLTLAAAEVKQINEIPKNKAGSGKRAKAAASKKLREAKLRQKDKAVQLEVVKKLLLDNTSEDLGEVLGASTNADDMGNGQAITMAEKRDRDDLPEENEGSVKKARLLQCEVGGGPMATTDSSSTDVSPSIDDPTTSVSAMADVSTSGSAMNDVSPSIDDPTTSVSAATDISPPLSDSGFPMASDSSSIDVSPSLGDSGSAMADDNPSTDISPSLGDPKILGLAVTDVPPPLGDEGLPSKANDNSLTNVSPSFGDLNKSDVEEVESVLQSFVVRPDDDDFDCGISDYSETETEEELYDADVPSSPSDTDEEKDADRVAYAEKHCKNPELRDEEQKLYRFLDDDNRKKWDEKGRKAIKEFLRDKTKFVDSSIQRMARLDPTYLPESACTSRRLAIHFVTSKEGNIQCGYHAYKNKSTFMRDGWGKVGAQIRGVPGKKRMSKKASDDKKKTSDDKKKDGVLNTPAKGVGNCGCRIDDILLEFVLAKRTKIWGTVDGSRVDELMTTQDYLDPRERSFAFQSLRNLTYGMSLNDFFLHNNLEPHKNMKLAKKQVLYTLGILNNMYKVHATDEFVYKEVVVISKERFLDLSAKEKKLEEMMASTHT